MMMTRKLYIKIVLFVIIVFSCKTVYGISVDIQVDSLLQHIKHNIPTLDKEKHYKTALLQAQYMDVQSLNKVRLHFGNYHLRLGEYSKASNLYFDIINSPVCQKEVAHAYNNLGIILKKQSNYKEALSLFDIAQQNYQQWDDKQKQARTLINIAQIHQYLGDFDKEIEVLFKARPLIDSMCTTKIRATLYYSLSSAHNTIKEYQKAIKLQELAIVLRKELNDQKGLSASYNELGNSYREQYQFKQAISFYKQAIVIKDSLGLSRSKAVSYHNLGSTYLNKDDLDSALYFYELAYAIRDSIADQRGLAMTAKELASTHLQNKNYDLVLHYLDQTKHWADSVGVLSMKLRVVDIKQDYFEALKQTDSALYYSKKYVKLYKVFYAEEKAKALLTLQEKYESKSKDKQIIGLKKVEEQLIQDKALKDLEIKQRNLILILLLITLLLLIILFFFYKNRTKLKQATEYQNGQELIKNKVAIALHDGVASKLSGIRFKTLAMTVSKEDTKDQLSITKELSALYESTRGLSHQLAPIAYHLENQTFTQALSHLCIDFERYRKIKTNVLGLGNIDLDHLKKQSKMALYSILEELLLNVYKHSKTSKVQISVSENKKNIIITVQDFGIGLSKQPKTGIGLNNIKSHTALLRGKFQMRNSTSGCTAQVTIPKKHNI